jgi:hypothetical protein
MTLESLPTVVSETPKSMREALCAAQSALGELARGGVDMDRVPTWIKQVQLIINQIDGHRPLRNDGKHADLHTDTCGCEGHTGPWSIVFRPSPAN